MARLTRGGPRSLIRGWHDPLHSLASGTVAVRVEGPQALQREMLAMNVAGGAEHPLDVGNAGFLSGW